MQHEKEPNQGFRRLWQRGLFRRREFQWRDNLNEYDEDYSLLETGDAQDSSPETEA